MIQVVHVVHVVHVSHASRRARSMRHAYRDTQASQAFCVHALAARANDEVRALCRESCSGLQQSVEEILELCVQQVANRYQIIFRANPLPGSRSARRDWMQRSHHPRR